MTTKIALLTTALAAALLAPGCKDDNTGDDGGSSTAADGGDATPGAGTAGGVTQPGDTDAQGDSAYIYITSTDSDTELYQNIRKKYVAFKQEICPLACEKHVRLSCGNGYDQCMETCTFVPDTFACLDQGIAFARCWTSVPDNQLYCDETGFVGPKEGVCDAEADKFTDCIQAVGLLQK